eukprot:GFUD01049220.1.p1 GENE.GFUD01049220.1~~GFUD01049220.1.p1  ORF type:complete len:176 (+),score=31.75 GFUD01049220.1:68-595(+)
MRRWGAIFDPASDEAVKAPGGVSPRDQVYRRAGHASWAYQHLIVSWGGVVEHIYNKPKGPNRTPTCGNSFHDPSLLVTYDPSTSEWGHISTSGDVPAPTVSAVSVPAHDLLYVFGGMIQTEEDAGGEYINLIYSSSNNLCALDIENRRWKKLQPAGDLSTNLIKCLTLRFITFDL